MNFIFPYIGLLIIPIDFHIFQRGSNHQPDMVFGKLVYNFRPEAFKDRIEEDGIHHSCNQRCSQGRDVETQTSHHARWSPPVNGLSHCAPKGSSCLGRMAQFTTARLRPYHQWEAPCDGEATNQLRVSDDYGIEAVTSMSRITLDMTIKDSRYKDGTGLVIPTPEMTMAISFPEKIRSSDIADIAMAALEFSRSHPLFFFHRATVDSSLSHLHGFHSTLRQRENSSHRLGWFLMAKKLWLSASDSNQTNPRIIRR